MEEKSPITTSSGLLSERFPDEIHQFYQAHNLEMTGKLILSFSCLMILVTMVIRMLQDYHFVSFFNKLLICRVLGITEWAGSFNFAIVLKSTQRAAMEGRPDRPIKQ